MNHDGQTDRRSVSETVAEARTLQGRHATRMLKAAARRLRNVFAFVSGERASFEKRQLIVR